MNRNRKLNMFQKTILKNVLFFIRKMIPYLLLSLIFVASIMVLKIPEYGELPNYEINSQVFHGIKSRADIELDDITAQQYNREIFENGYPVFFVYDLEWQKAIEARIDLLKTELKRRSVCEMNGNEYLPEGGKSISLFQHVKALTSYSFQAVSQIYLSKEKILSEKQNLFQKKIMELLNNGIIGNGEMLNYNKQQYILVDLQNKRYFEAKDYRSLNTVQKASEILSKLILSDSADKINLDGVASLWETILLEGNIRQDKELRSEHMKKDWEEEPESIRNPKREIRQNELIFEPGHVMTENDILLYRQYRTELNALRKISFWSHFLRLYPKIALTLMLLVFCSICLYDVRSELTRDYHSVLVIGCIVIFSLYTMHLFTRLWYAYNWNYPVPEYLFLPLALPALVVAPIYGGGAALFAGIYVSGVSAIAVSPQFETFFLGLFVSGLSAVFIRKINDYKKLFSVSILISIVPSLIAMLLFIEPRLLLEHVAQFSNTLKHGDLSNLTFQDFPVELCTIVCQGVFTSIMGVIVLIFLDLFRSISTNLSYLTLTDRNNPLLKNLQSEAPGTYYHSIRVSDIANAAAEKIKLNSLKVQALSLFHDIGKMEQPEHFTENDPERMGHAGLTFKESAACIKKHVTDGMQIAKQGKLKNVVVRAIEQHHGNDKILYFYQKEKERIGHEPEHPDDFQYSGSIPLEKENTILMLADCSEAAVASLPKPDKKSIREKIEEVIVGKYERKQLDLSRLTMSELAAVRESFISSLLNMNHSRIAYSSNKQTQTGINIQPRTKAYLQEEKRNSNSNFFVQNKKRRNMGKNVSHRTKTEDN